jgi:hypothetical protein
VATRIMVEEGKGKELKAKLEQYKKDMAGISPQLNGQINNI